MPDVSIIIPIYKVEHYLRKCVDSVLAQSFPDFELILVDDGSPDGCGAICDEYASADSRVRVIHRTNGGLSAARNSGLDVAKGKWIVFIDSDDWINVQYIESLLSMDDGKVEILLSGICEERGEKHCFVGPQRSGYYSAEDIYDQHNLLAVWAAGKVFKRTAIGNIRFREGIIQEDEFFTYQIFFTNGPIGYSRDAVYHYVQREDSIVGGKWNAARLICIEGMKAQWQFFVDKKLPLARDHVEERFLQWLAVAIMCMKKDCPDDDKSQRLLWDELRVAKRRFKNALHRSPVVQYSVGLALHPRLRPLLKIRYAIRILLNDGADSLVAKIFQVARRKKS